MRNRHLGSWLLAGSLAIAAGSFGWLWAQSQNEAAESGAAAALLPADALIYFSSDGSLEHQQAWKQTAAYKSLETSGLLPAIRSAAHRLIEQIDDPRAKTASDQLLDLVRQVEHNGFSFAAAVRPPQGGPPTAYAIAVFPGAAEKAAPLLDLILQESRHKLKFQQQQRMGGTITSAIIPDSPGIEIAWWNEKGSLVVVSGIQAVESALAVVSHSAEDVTENPLYKKYVAAKQDYETNWSFWVDAKAIRNLVSGFPLPGEQRDPANPVRVGDILALLGLDGLNAVVSQGGYQGEAIWSDVWVEAPAPRRGLLSLSDGAPLDLADLPPLPEGLTSFSAARLDLAKLCRQLLAAARDVAKLAPADDAPQQLEDALAQANEKLGFDISKDLLDHLGDVVITYDDPRQGILTLGRGALVKLSNPEAFRKSLDKLVAFADHEAAGRLAIRRTDKGGRELTTVEFFPSAFGQSWCIADDWLVFGQPQTIEAFLARLDGKLPAWKPSAEHQTALAEMPTKFNSVMVGDPRGSVNVLMGMAPFALQFIKTGVRASKAVPLDFQFPLEVEDFPPAELISQPLFPNVLTGEINAAGFHYRSRGSLPGIPIIGSGDAATTTAVAAIGVALLLPAVQQVRMAARRSQSQNNLKQMAIALHNYEGAHMALPAGTVPNDELEPEKRLSWMVEILPYVEQAALYRSMDQKASWEATANNQAVGSVVPTFQNPAVEQATYTRDDGAEVAVTHYVGIAGLGEKGPTLPVTDPKAGWFAYDRATRFRDVTDGTSNTVMISEASEDFGGWAAGGRSTIRAFTQQPYINGPDGIGSPFPGGCNMSLGDGSVRFLSQEIDPSVMEALSTIRGGEVIPQY